MTVTHATLGITPTPQAGTDLSVGAVPVWDGSANLQMLSSIGPTRPANFPMSETALASLGTDTTIVATEGYIAEGPRGMPGGKVITGLSILKGGTVGGADKCFVALYDELGTRVAISAESAALVTVNIFQDIAFLVPYTVRVPGQKLFVFIQVSANTTKIRTLSAGYSDIMASKVTGLTYASGPPATITPPITFTTALGPMCQLYT